MSYIVYKIVEKSTNNIVYVGCTSQKLKNRFLQHISGDTTATKNKIALDTHYIEAIEVVNDKKEAIDREKYWTETYRKSYNLLNIRVGTDGFVGKDNPMFNKRHSEKSKKLISIHKTGQSYGEDFKKKISNMTKGNKNPRCRKVRCIETNKIFDFIKEAAKFYNINYQCISLNCRGKIKYAGIYNGLELHWEFV